MTITKRYTVLIGVILFVLLFVSLVSACDSVAQPEKEKEVAVQINQMGKDYTFIFRGGAGQSQVKDITVEVIAPDGTKQTGTLSPDRVGNEVTITGTGCGDRVLVTVTYMNGYYYVIYDDLMDVISGFCDTPYYVAQNPCEGTSESSYMQPGGVAVIPDDRSVIIQANPNLNELEVQFRGGFGQNILSYIEVEFIEPDGTHEVKELSNASGDEVTFTSTQCIGRLVATAYFMDGMSYRFYDSLIRFLGRY
ncbi:MAG: hypothetical protein JXA44_05800 [Methanospirillaceae archaeon]|nr:hypothetical protein [Methanospirillaceae archaeon]